MIFVHNDSQRGNADEIDGIDSLKSLDLFFRFRSNLALFDGRVIDDWNDIDVVLFTLQLQPIDSAFCAAWFTQFNR
jgi:hypothetical protein